LSASRVATAITKDLVKIALILISPCIVDTDVTETVAMRYWVVHRAAEAGGPLDALAHDFPINLLANNPLQLTNLTLDFAGNLFNDTFRL
jgi:hypothetical protein